MSTLITLFSDCLYIFFYSTSQDRASEANIFDPVVHQGIPSLFQSVHAP